MNRQTLLRVLIATCAIFALSLAPIERVSLKLFEFAIYLAIACLVGTVATSILAMSNVHSLSKSGNFANAALFGASPLCVGFLLFVLRIQPNVHGIAIISIFLYSVTSITFALVLLLWAVFRSARAD